ncbi:addiction module antidote protein [Devosia sp. A369]
MVKLHKYDSAEYLTSDEAVLAYLQEAIDSDDPKMVSHALGVVARARGMSQIARDAGVSRESLYRTLSDEGNPEFGTVMKIVRALGMKLSVAPASNDNCHAMA